MFYNSDPLSQRQAEAGRLPELTFLEKAYDAGLQKFVPRDLFNLAHAELVVDLRRFPHLSPIARNEPKLAQALIFLCAKAIGNKRKINGSAAYLHTLEVAEDFLDLTKKLIPDEKRKVRALVKIVLHDTLEDFHATGKEIDSLFGRYVMTRTRLVTSPPMARLALDFPDITQKFTTLPENGSQRDAQKHLTNLQAENPGTYEALKAALKTGHKCRIARRYSLDEAIYRAIDNAHSLKSYAKDIADGLLVVERDAENAEAVHNKKILLPEDARANITNRTKGHEAILSHLLDMQEKALRYQNVSKKERRRIEASISQINKYFSRHKDNLEKAILHPAHKFQASRLSLFML